MAGVCQEIHGDEAMINQNALNCAGEEGFSTIYARAW